MLLQLVYASKQCRFLCAIPPAWLNPTVETLCARPCASFTMCLVLGSSSDIGD